MSQIELKYNYIKIILFMIFAILMIALFSHIFLNSYEFSLREPGFGRFKWVGRFFYKNVSFLSIMSILMVVLFSYFLISLTKMLFSKNIIIKNESNYIYINEKKIESLSNIRTISTVRANNNKKIHLFYKEPRNRKIAKYIPSIFKKWFQKNEYIYDITFTKEKPAEVNILLKKILKYN